MVVAFCGHASYVENPMDENRVLRFLENEIRECAVEFFLGEYGAFDSFAYRCAKKYKDKHPQSKLIFIALYISYSIIYVMVIFRFAKLPVVPDGTTSKIGGFSHIP